MYRRIGCSVGLTCLYHDCLFVVSDIQLMRYSLILSLQFWRQAPVKKYRHFGEKQSNLNLYTPYFYSSNQITRNQINNFFLIYLITTVTNTSTQFCYQGEFNIGDTPLFANFFKNCLKTSSSVFYGHSLLLSNFCSPLHNLGGVLA